MFKVPLSNNEYNNCSTQDEILCQPLSDTLVTPDEVESIIFALDDNKATGPDKIPAKLLQCCASQISCSLCDLFNMSLTSGRILTAWKISNIVLVPKCGL